MKKLRNWFIGDYLEKTDDVFERAKIELLCDYAMMFIFLGSIYYVGLIVFKLWYHVYVTSFAVVALCSMPFILKYFQNVRLAATWYVVQQIIVSFFTILIEEGKPDMTGGFWVALFILFVFFLFGRKWGLIISLINMAVSSLPPILFKNLHFSADQHFPRTPVLWLLPLTLIIFVVWTFIRTRGEAEKQIDNQRTALSEKNKEITDSITYAQRIQNAILPAHRLIAHYLPQSFVVYLPKAIVSGDFYWVEKKGDTVFFAVVDCTGHGVPGAMMSVIGQNALNRVVNEFDVIQPAAILDRLNDLVEETFSRGGSEVRDGMDIALCAWNTKTNLLEYAGANNALYLLRNGEITEHKADKQPIGRFEKRFPFTNQQLQLLAGDRVYLFSDGIADQFGGPEGKKFKYRRLKELLVSISGASMQQQKNEVLAAFYSWKGSLEQIDDVCIFGVQVTND